MAPTVGRVAEVREKLKEDIRVALDQPRGGVLFRAHQGLGKTSAAIDAIVARARRGAGAVVVASTRRLVLEIYQTLRARLPPAVQIALVVGKKNAGGGLGVGEDGVTSCVNPAGLGAAMRGCRAPGVCKACPDREDCAGAVGGLLHSMDAITDGPLGRTDGTALISVVTESMLRAMISGGEFPTGFAGRPLVLDDTPAGARSVSRGAIRAAENILREDRGGILGGDLQRIGTWLAALRIFFDEIGEALPPGVAYGPPQPLRAAMISQAEALVPVATILHEEGSLPAGVVALLGRASTAWVAARRDDEGQVDVAASFTPAPLNWPGAVVALDATGHVWEYGAAWPGREWTVRVHEAPGDPERIRTVWRQSPRWKTSYLKNLQDNHPPDVVEGTICKNTERELDLVELQGRAIAQVRRTMGQECRARVLLPRAFLQAAPGLEGVLRGRIGSWGYADVDVSHWRSAVSRGTNTYEGTAFTFSLGAPRGPQAPYLPPPVVRAVDWRAHAGFWSAEDAPRAWRDPGEPEALRRMVADSADALDQEIRRDRAETTDSPAPVLRWCVLPPPIRITMAAPPAWVAGEGYPSMEVVPGGAVPSPPQRLRPIGERPAVLRAPGVAHLSGEIPAKGRLPEVLRRIDQEDWKVVTSQRLMASMGWAERSARRFVTSLSRIALGVVRLGGALGATGGQVNGALVCLCSPSGALDDARGAYPSTTSVIPNSALSTPGITFGHFHYRGRNGGTGRPLREAPAPPITAPQATVGTDGIARSWTEMPLVLRGKQRCMGHLEQMASSTPDRAAWARARKRQIEQLSDGDLVPLGAVYRSVDGRLRDRHCRATSSRDGERAHLHAQPGHVLVDFDLEAAHAAAAFAWSGEEGDPAAAYSQIQEGLGIDRPEAKVSFVAWINGAGAGRLEKITGRPGGLTFLQGRWPKIAKLLAKIREYYEATPPGGVMKICTGAAPASWSFDIVKPEGPGRSFRTVASRMWSRPEALWLDHALAIISRGAVPAAVAVPLYDGVLVQMPVSPWHPWRVAWLADTLTVAARHVGLQTVVRARHLGETWGGPASGGGPPGVGP